jgi:hypothetical protein
VPRGRHSLETSAAGPGRLALLAAPLVTVLAVGVGVATSGSGVPAADSSAAGSVSAAAAPSTIEDSAAGVRTLATSRSTERVPLVNNRVPKAKGKLWTSSPLDLRVEPREKAKVAGLLDSGKQVAVTGRRQGAYAEVIVNRTARWVTADYLSKDKAPEAMGLNDKPCPDGSSIESALQPDSVKVYRAVCAAFPELSSYGGQDGHGEHVNGEAIDFMVPSASVGERVKDFVYAHRAELNLFDIIWSQHIWTIERSGEGFRSMSDRGSATANHYDHVHIKIN